MKYIKYFESYKRGLTKVEVKNVLLGNCDSEIKSLKEVGDDISRLDELVSLKENLDSDLSELDFFIRANFYDLPGFKEYIYDYSGGHPNYYVKCKLEIAFSNDQLSEKEVESVMSDFLTDCKELKSIKMIGSRRHNDEIDEDEDEYPGYDIWNYKGHPIVSRLIVIYLSTPTERIPSVVKYNW
jgi:hypothetical protein